MKVRDILERLHSKYSIPNETHGKIISKTEETARIFSAKCRYRLCKFDSPEARMVVVLEYVLRKGIFVTPCHASIVVPMKELGKLINIKEAGIKQVATIAGHYLDDATASSNNSAKLYSADTKAAKGAMGRYQSTNTRNHARKINTTNNLHTMS